MESGVESVWTTCEKGVEIGGAAPALSGQKRPLWIPAIHAKLDNPEFTAPRPTELKNLEHHLLLGAFIAVKLARPEP